VLVPPAQGLDPGCRGVETHEQDNHIGQRPDHLNGRLLVELREPDEFPASIFIIWPQAPSVVDPRRFGATANAVARLMASAITKLAQIRAYEP
jgi:hypothetical protein